MGNTVLKAENISKHYRLGVIGSGSLKEDIQSLWKKTFTTIQNIPSKQPLNRDKKNDLWALKDVNFEIMQGDVVGFVGKNGAGKSTILKLLSRITLPTTGSIRGRGRIASLLEVGTGFHGELTGRENIFLNGQILGMNKWEIKSQFDEIVDFSGIEKFLDTPVKRYSSGMYVRLAFAIAAHLDPDILIVDEVLAVGDAEFQKKCLGKMKQVSTENGKTVLFVSHNSQALKNLCTKAIYLKNGRVVEIGHPNNVIANYSRREKTVSLSRTYNEFESAPGNDHIRVRSVSITPGFIDDISVIDIRTPLVIDFEFWYKPSQEIELAAHILLYTSMDECIFEVNSLANVFDGGVIKGNCTIPGNFLNYGSYYITLIFVKNTTDTLFELEECLSFDVEDYRENTAWYGDWPGAVRPRLKVDLQQEKTAMR